MQILIYRYSPGVYGLEWRGNTDRQDLRLAKEELWRLASLSGDTQIILLVDFSQVNNLPFDPRDFRHIIGSDNRVQMHVLINAPIRAQLLANEIQRVGHHEIRFVDSLASGIKMAQGLMITTL